MIFSSGRSLPHMALLANNTIRGLGQVRQQVIDVFTLAHVIGI